MTIEFVGKKLELIETAGQLFADLGVQGTSIRHIVKKCGVNIASINYYFGSKENLYIETLKYVAWQVRCPLANQLLSKSSIDFSSIQTKQKIIKALVKERVEKYLSDKYPTWYSKLLLRSLIEPPENLKAVIQNTFLLELNDLIEVFSKCAPQKNKEECRYWAFSLLGEVSFYAFAEPAVKLSLSQEGGYSKKFLKKLQDHISSLILKGLDLWSGNV
ncbi:MAG: CerR family C-terminal domain-containing protein [Candidatus Hydrogenedentes bacterium]|nr:CerR family C-terminal domain-containing protein [Candidatus Hydrogenedentota bacterium]